MCIRDSEWTSSTITGARYAAIYDDTLTNKPLICAIDFGGDFSTTSGTFKITWNASGIFTLDLPVGVNNGNSSYRVSHNS